MSWWTEKHNDDGHEYYAVHATMSGRPEVERKPGILFDTLNCDSVLTLDEQRAIVEHAVSVVNAHNAGLLAPDATRTEEQPRHQRARPMTDFPTIAWAEKIQADWLKGTADGTIPDHDSRQLELKLQMSQHDEPGAVTVEIFRTNPLKSHNSDFAVDLHFFRDGLTFGVEAITRASLRKLARFLDEYDQRMGEF